MGTAAPREGEGEPGSSVRSHQSFPLVPGCPLVSLVGVRQSLSNLGPTIVEKELESPQDP